MALRNFNNVTSVGTLSAPLASSATSVTVTGFTGIPTVPFTVTLDRNTPTEEICLVTAVAGSTLTVTRGFDGTAAIAHSAGATIEHTAGAIEYQEANAHTNATANVHGSTGNVVGDQGAQSIFDKTLVSPVLQGDVTAGDAAVAYDPTGSRNLFRGVDSGGTDVVTIDHAGSISTTANLSVGGTTSTGGLLTANGGITVPAGKTLTASGGVVASQVTNNGNGTVAGTLGVTGATTLSGAATLAGGATVPTGKKLTLTDAPTAGTDAANKTYVDSLAAGATSAATPNALMKRDAAGRAQVVDPSASADIATKNYVDNGMDTAWQTPTLLNGYANVAGLAVARYRKLRNGQTEVQGHVSGTSGQKAVFNLPAGYRPASQLRFATAASDAFARVDVLTTGDVQMSATGNPSGYLSLNFTFLAEA